MSGDYDGRWPDCPRCGTDSMVSVYLGNEAWICFDCDVLFDVGEGDG